MFRIYDFDYAHKSFPMCSLIKVQFKNLLEEISRLLVGKIAKLIIIKLVIVHLDVVHALFDLLFADLLNALLVVVKYDGQ